MIRFPVRDPNGIMNVLQDLRAVYEEQWNSVFEMIITDNGAEFSTLSNLEQPSKTLVYFAHPYALCEKGSIERHDGLIRRFYFKRNELTDLVTN